MAALTAYLPDVVAEWESWVRQNKNSADSSGVTHNPGETGIDLNGEYSELVQRSYDALFDPWLNPDDEQADDDQEESD